MPLSSFSSFPEFDRQSDQSGERERVGRPTTNSRPGMRRKTTTGDMSIPMTTSPPGPGPLSRPALSPLNPRARGASGGGAGVGVNPTAAVTQQAQKGRQTISLTRK